MDYQSQHSKALETLCRICSRKLSRVSYSTGTPAVKGGDSSLIEVCFKTQPDNPTIHPPRFCNSVLSHHEADEEGQGGRHSIPIIPHTTHLGRAQGGGVQHL